MPLALRPTSMTFATLRVPASITTIVPGPAVVGIALLLIAGIFEYGRRLEKDTEGLV